MYTDATHVYDITDLVKMEAPIAMLLLLLFFWGEGDFQTIFFNKVGYESTKKLLWGCWWWWQFVEREYVCAVTACSLCFEES